MPSRAEIEADLVAQVAAKLGQEPDGVDPERPLHELGFDSMRLVELFLHVEDVHGLELMSMGLSREDMESIRALASYIESALAESQ